MDGGLVIYHVLLDEILEAWLEREEVSISVKQVIERTRIYRLFHPEFYVPTRLTIVGEFQERYFVLLGEL
jgi:hypothetical protein